jgi:predicted nuclease of predicted toxin-antitoxin system
LPQSPTYFLAARIVRDVGLARADDAAVWAFAREGGFTIVTKDGDFHQMSFVRGAPPKVIWMRVGNCSTDQMLA